VDVAQIYPALWTLHQAELKGELSSSMLARSGARLRRSSADADLSSCLAHRHIPSLKRNLDAQTCSSQWLMGRPFTDNQVELPLALCDQ